MISSSFTKRSRRFVPIVLAGVLFTDCSGDPNKRKFGYLQDAEKYFKSGKSQEAVIQYRNALAMDPRFAPAHYGLGEAYLALNRTDAAYRELTEAVTLDPANVDARLKLARLLLGRRQLDQAQSFAQKVLATQPGNARAHAILGEKHTLTGDYGKAIEELEKVVALEPQQVENYGALGAAYRAASQFPEAENAYKKAIQANPKSAQARNDNALALLQRAAKAAPDSAKCHYFWGVAQQSAGFPDLAKASFHRALALQPQMPAAEGALANLVARSGNPDEALRLAGNARKTNPDLPSTYLASAKALLVKGDLRQTETVLLDALKREPVSLPAQSMLLSLYIRQGRGQEAVQRLADLVQQHPKNAGLHVLLGLAYFNLNNLQRAEANALDALKLDPKTPDAYTLLANINLARGAVEEAKANLRAAIAAHPRSLLNYMALMTQYEKEGNWEEAKKLRQKTHEIDPDAPLVAVELAFLYLEHGGEVNVAVSLAQAAKQKMPNSPITADALGWAFYKLGWPASAITQLKESTGKAPNNPIYQYHLGMAYMATHRADLAAQALRLALKTNPHFRYAESARAEMAKLPKGGT